MPIRRQRPRRHRHHSGPIQSFARFVHRLTGGERDRRVARAVGYGLEALEQRTLLTTIGFDATTNTQIPDGIFEYSQGQPGNLVRVAWHNVVAELIGVSVPGPNDQTAPTPPDVPTAGEDLI